MFKKLLLIAFGFSLISFNGFSQRYIRCDGGDIIVIEHKVKPKPRPRNDKVIVINNHYNSHYSDYDDDCNNNEWCKIDYDELFDGERIKPNEMWQQTIHFRLAQYRLGTEDLPTIENVALFLEEHPNLKIGLYGYASKARGSWDNNYDLAKRRIESVCRALSQYGVDVRERVEIFVRGTANHQYDEDSWNQCVIIKVI